jgi:hypothetical protein
MVNDAEAGPINFTTAERLLGLLPFGGGGMMCSLAPPVMVMVHIG